ncbi:unnamed protein product [Choristocarpus tenellus]
MGLLRPCNTRGRDGPTFSQRGSRRSAGKSRVSTESRGKKEIGLSIAGTTKDGGEGKNINAFMMCMLGDQPELKVIEPSIKILVERLDGYCQMLPKYLCKLDPIEVIWGWGKEYLMKTTLTIWREWGLNIPICLLDGDLKV